MSVGPDKICGVVARTRHKMMQVELREAATRGAKFLEVRLDYLTKAVDFKRLQAYKGCPWMATFRRPVDGGRWSGSEAERQMVLRQAVVSGVFDWIDLETDVIENIRRFGPVKRVVSYHNMTETPQNLDEIYDQMLTRDADVYKIAVMPKTADDLQRVIEIQKRAPKPTVAFAMGEFGFVTRFTALKFGAPWIYGAFNKERGIAPGLPALHEFRTTYPVRAIGPNTKFFALLGDPVGHSYSPILHNHLFRRLKVDAVYVPFRVPDGQLADATDAMNTVPMSGYSVTIPHKEAAALRAKEVDPMVHIVGAANTLQVRADGTFLAANTDYPAALESLRTHLDAKALTEGVKPPDFSQLFVLVLGAGGAARAIVASLVRAGASVTISSRTAERATKLAEQIGGKSCDWQARHSVAQCDILINCTPVGMHPKVDDSPVHASFLKPGLVVFDTVYNPEHTLLIRDAESRGCTTISGVDMFVRQAAKQFEIFTGITPPLEDMRELLRKAMSPLTAAMDTEAEKSGGMGEAGENA